MPGKSQTQSETKIQYFDEELRLTHRIWKRDRLINLLMDSFVFLSDFIFLIILFEVLSIEVTDFNVFFGIEGLQKF